MTANYKNSISALLLLSCVLLGALVPGGSIETRNFSHINPFVLACFNIFLTLLAMISILVVYYLLQDVYWAYTVTTFCGVAYFLVYILDLAGIFPVSPNPMSQILFTVEVVGLNLSLPLIFLSIKKLSLLNSLPEKRTRQFYSRRFVYFACFLCIVSLGVVIFATKSAMGM